MGDCIDIGLVNNMPDSALKGTERQFLRLLEGAADRRTIRLRLFTLPEIERSDRARQHCSESYGTLGDLLSSHLDALIITGAEPRAQKLRDEPYWRSLTTVFDWAAENTVSTVTSCLAAHAAVLHFDGIERRRLGRKCLGVFDHAATAPHMLTEGAAAPWRVAHSRWNEAPEAALEAAGYTVLTRSEQAGPDLFVRSRGSLFVQFQRHPEYEAETLLKEYQRDVRRFLMGEQDNYPTMPAGYFDAAAIEAVCRFEALALAWRHPIVLEQFPTGLLAGPQRGWSAPARCVYGNWLRYVAAEKARRNETLAVYGEAMLVA